MNLSVLKAERIMVEHKKRIAELSKLIYYGDWVKVSEKTNGEISKENCQMAFRRIHSKHHHYVTNLLEQVIEERLAKFQSNK